MMLQMDTVADIQELAEKLAPFMAQKLLMYPKIWGDPKRIQHGKNVEVVNTLFNTTSGNIVLEDGVFCGHNVCLLTGTHDITKTGYERSYSFPTEGYDIVIRKGVWLASNVTVIGPCEIGENAVVAAGSLVLENIPANCLYAGSPAKFIKKIGDTRPF